MHRACAAALGGGGASTAALPAGACYSTHDHHGAEHTNTGMSGLHVFRGLLGAVFAAGTLTIMVLNTQTQVNALHVPGGGGGGDCSSMVSRGGGQKTANSSCCCLSTAANLVYVGADVLQEQEAIAESVMASLPDALQQQGLGRLHITLKGLSTFRNQVGR